MSGGGRARPAKFAVYLGDQNFELLGFRVKEICSSSCSCFFMRPNREGV